ncbi:translesion DNA synthesis-associated protein ImuA [Roseateles chitinivorans]|uniref:translesion DNA synthesis-associated protein ImuA n=1 Tax=Roseateles chitinivorans TaxID=2917965 RepID=UPI003D67F0A9
MEAALWRGDQLGSPVSDVESTGFPALDAVLPGGGWPSAALTEVLVSQFSIVEFRLLAPTIGALTARGRTVALVGPALRPHMPGLRHHGVDDRYVVWVDVDAPRDRLWSTEQLIKAGSCGAVIAWLPLVRAEQVRRLQVLASHCRGPVFLCRPESAGRDSSAAPLRVAVRVQTDWQIEVQVLKRKGSPLEESLPLLSMPGGLDTIMTPRLRHPSRLVTVEPSHAVDSPVAAAERKPDPVLEPSRS